MFHHAFLIPGLYGKCYAAFRDGVFHCQQVSLNIFSRIISFVRL